ncbi:hypothetical protein CAAN1_18S00672 [[Candida] anglica]|uniref:Uncharacterized protein n=1 Tax=[Candida] anglica TaxID=148631 RepID=A0ABP0ELS1_9ASCO
MYQEDRLCMQGKLLQEVKIAMIYPSIKFVTTKPIPLRMSQIDLYQMISFFSSHLTIYEYMNSIIRYHCISDRK